MRALSYFMVGAAALLGVGAIAQRTMTPPNPLGPNPTSPRTVVPAPATTGAASGSSRCAMNYGTRFAR